MKYVLGFIFDSSLEKVLLIKKERPDWQKGKYNGVGGKIEKKETPKQAMTREALEETDLLIAKKDWIPVGIKKGKEWSVEIFTTVYPQNLKNAKSMTDEKIYWVNIDQLPEKSISNLAWLIPLCLDKIKTGIPQKVTISY